MAKKRDRTLNRKANKDKNWNWNRKNEPSSLNLQRIFTSLKFFLGHHCKNYRTPTVQTVTNCADEEKELRDRSSSFKYSNVIKWCHQINANIAFAISHKPFTMLQNDIVCWHGRPWKFLGSEVWNCWRRDTEASIWFDNYMGSWVLKVQQTEARSTWLRVSSPEFLFNYTQICLFLKSHLFRKYSHLIIL